MNIWKLNLILQALLSEGRKTRRDRERSCVSTRKLSSCSSHLWSSSICCCCLMSVSSIRCGGIPWLRPRAPPSWHTHTHTHQHELEQCSSARSHRASRLLAHLHVWRPHRNLLSVMVPCFMRVEDRGLRWESCTGHVCARISRPLHKSQDISFTFIHLAHALIQSAPVKAVK